MEWTSSRIFVYVQLFTNDKAKSIHRISLKWKDKRLISGNEGRNTSCPSKQVAWTKDDQFWLPQLDIWDAIELARIRIRHLESEKINKFLSL